MTQYRDFSTEINKITSSLHPNKRYRTKKERITILQKLSIYIAEKAMWVFFLRIIFAQSFFFFPPNMIERKKIFCNQEMCLERQLGGR